MLAGHRINGQLDFGEGSVLIKLSALANPIPKRLSLTDELADKLRSMILSGELKQGDRIPTEQDLVESMHVSRTVVREAIACLKSEGLVMTRQGVGAFVVDRIRPRPFDIDTEEMESLEDAVLILELRMAVEIGMAAAAAKRRDPEHIDAMWRHFEAIKQADADGKDSAPADFALHRAIAEASKNPYFLRFMEFLGSRIIPPRDIALDDKSSVARKKYTSRIRDEHKSVIEAIERQDSAAAGAAMRAHLTRSTRQHQKRLG